MDFTQERTIGTGGTGDIIAGTAKIGDKDAGRYIIKSEYYEGDIDDQIYRYSRCRDAGLPVPRTFRKGVDENGDNVLIVTDLLHDAEAVWSLNDSKERGFPEHEDGSIASQIEAIAIVAAENGIGIEAYAYLAVVRKDKKVEILIGDMGNTEVRFPFDIPEDRGNYPEDLTHGSLKERNIQQAQGFLKGAGLLKAHDRTPAQNIPIPL